MAKRQIISVRQAASILGCNPQKVRERMKRKQWKIGLVIPPGDGCSQTQYDIYVPLLESMIGREIAEEELR